MVFALKPIMTALSKVKQKVDGLNLLNKGNLLSYSDLEKYYQINNGKSLAAIIKEGNSKGLLKAINKLNDGGLSRIKNNPNQTMASLISSFKADVSELVGLHKRPDFAQHEAAFLSKSDQAVEKLLKMDTLRKALIDSAEKAGNARLVKKVRDLPKFTKFFARHAKISRIPIDLVSFGIVGAGIGFFPVWLNHQINKRRFAREMASQQAGQAAVQQPQDPQALFNALKASSKASSRLRLSQSAY